MVAFVAFAAVAFDEFGRGVVVGTGLVGTGVELLDVGGAVLVCAAVVATCRVASGWVELCDSSSSSPPPSEAPGAGVVTLAGHTHSITRPSAGVRSGHVQYGKGEHNSS